MSRDTEDLEAEFRDQVKTLLERVRLRGFELVPFFTLRHPQEQAKLWRQSRSTDEIYRTINKIDREGAPWIAELVEKVGPQYGRWATNALPGQSWHQWGEAIDCFVKSDTGRAVWSARHPGYEAYAEVAKELGMEPGFYWTRRDAVHVQKRPQGVRHFYTWPEINDYLRTHFGES